MVGGGPVDVNQITAVTPDNTKIKLEFERRTRTWHGYWEIPYGFKKGTYYATLIAANIEGKTFEGQTKGFYIAEPNLVTMIGIEYTREVEVKEEIKEPPATAPIEQAVQAPAGRPSVPARKLKKAARAARAVIKKTEAQKREEAMVKARLIASARFYLKNQEYRKANMSLKSLLKMEPGNKDIRAVVNRIEELQKAKSGKP